MPFSRISIGSSAAAKFGETKWWESRTAHEITRFQLFTVEMCCPLGVLVEAVEKSIGRPVWMTDFAYDLEGICTEFLDGVLPPDAEEICRMIPFSVRAERKPCGRMETGLNVEAIQQAVRNFVSELSVSA